MCTEGPRATERNWWPFVPSCFVPWAEWVKGTAISTSNFVNISFHDFPHISKEGQYHHEAFEPKAPSKEWVLAPGHLDPTWKFGYFWFFKATRDLFCWSLLHGHMLRIQKVMPDHGRALGEKISLIRVDAVTRAEEIGLSQSKFPSVFSKSIFTSFYSYATNETSKGVPQWIPITIKLSATGHLFSCYTLENGPKKHPKWSSATLNASPFSLDATCIHIGGALEHSLSFGMT